jgi:hypothetical protein
MRLLPVIAVLVLAGCETESGPSVPRPGSELLPAEILAFEEGGPPDHVAISEEPVYWPEFIDWWSEEISGEPVADEPDRTYVAARGVTGCRWPEGALVTRKGPDLSVEFTGGVEQETCARAFTPSVLLAVRSADIEGVRTVNGVKPGSTTGPGRLMEFVPLGAGHELIPSAVDLADDPDPLYAALEAAGVSNLPEARAALEARPPAGHRGFAFVEDGCADTGAVLLIDDPITVMLTGGEGTACDAPEYYLATFEVPAEYVPEGVELGGS